jgi:hypothetical protein
MSGRVGYNRKNKGKPSYQPMLTFIAGTREYAGGVLHNGDKPTGESIARHLARVMDTLPKTVETFRARVDGGRLLLGGGEGLHGSELRICHRGAKNGPVVGRVTGGGVALELCTPCDPAGLIRVRAMAKGTSASPPTLG